MGLGKVNTKGRWILFVTARFFVQQRVKSRSRTRRCWQLSPATKLELDSCSAFFKIMPQFCLLDARIDETGLWRHYSLTGQGVECDIAEDFVPNLFHLKVPGMNE